MVENAALIDEMSLFKKKISSLIKLDLTNYKNAQMERRILAYMHKNGMDNLLSFYKVLEKDAEMLEQFVNMLTINVSEFFRNQEKFEELEQVYLPELLKRKSCLKIWSAGCSIGAEIYSIAMILDKLNKLESCKLIASDFDINIINKAKSGIYLQHEVQSMPDEYMRYFTKTDDSEEKYILDSKIVNSVKFERSDLLNSSFEKNFDLVLCRNVVIYFTEEAKDVLYKKFYDSLLPGGILFIGSTERIQDHKSIGYNLLTPFFYQKPL